MDADGGFSPEVGQASACLVFVRCEKKPTGYSAFVSRVGILYENLTG